MSTSSNGTATTQPTINKYYQSQNIDDDIFGLTSFQVISLVFCLYLQLINALKLTIKRKQNSDYESNHTDFMCNHLDIYCLSLSIKI